MKYENSPRKSADALIGIEREDHTISHIWIEDNGNIRDTGLELLLGYTKERLETLIEHGRYYYELPKTINPAISETSEMSEIGYKPDLPLFEKRIKKDLIIPPDHPIDIPMDQESLNHTEFEKYILSTNINYIYKLCLNDRWRLLHTFKVYRYFTPTPGILGALVSYECNWMDLHDILYKAVPFFTQNAICGRIYMKSEDLEDLIVDYLSTRKTCEFRRNNPKRI